MPDKGQITTQLWIGIYRKMGLGIKAVIDCKASLCPQARVMVGYWPAASISEDVVISLYELPKRVLRIRLYPRQGGGRVHIPKRDLSSFRLASQHLALQLFILRTHTTMFDYQIATSCFPK